MAILLMLHDRIDSAFSANYNKILQIYIESIVESKVKIDVASKVECVPFYISLMIGDQPQRETYARVLLSITKREGGTSDDTVSKRISQANEKYFT